MTAATFALTLGYFVVGLQALIAGSDPTINYSVLYNYYGNDQGLNLFDANHSFAISVKGIDDMENKFDPRYVRIVAQYFDYTHESGYLLTQIPLVQCT